MAISLQEARERRHQEKEQRAYMLDSRKFCSSKTLVGGRLMAMKNIFKLPVSND